MSLFVRLQSSFWNHRKTLRLRARIGDSAYWLPPRLWSYAAENQPDGDFSNYLPEELAMLLAYVGDAQAMLEAMQQAGFMDGMRIHDWQEHNAYHSTFSERAKKAAEARWGKRKEAKEKTVQERKGKEASIATSMLEASEGRFKEWMTFRRGMGKNPKDWSAMFNEQIQWLLKFPVAERSEIISQSIRNGWQGLFELKGNNGKNQQRPAESSRNLGTRNAGHGSDYAYDKLPPRKPAAAT